MEMNESGFGNIPYRIRVGVAGERSTARSELFRNSIRHILGNQPRDSRILQLFGTHYADILSSIPHTKIAFTFVTGFQEGANQLFAEEIMKLEGSKIQLILPIEESEYEKKYSSEQARINFRTLLKNEAAIRSPNRLYREYKDSAESSVRAYEYIVKHCDVVVVIGDPAEDEEDFLDLANREKRPIIRIQNSQTTFEAGHGLNGKPLLRLEEYNRHKLLTNEVDLYSENVYRDTFEKEGKGGDTIPEEAKSTIRRILIPHYARASKIAKLYQKSYKITGNLVYIFSAIAVVCVALAVKFDWHFGYKAELVLLSLILAAVGFSAITSSHKRWIETRFLAERIRAAMFLAAAGVEVSPIYLPPYMGAAHRQDDWMVMAFHEIWEQMPVMRGCQGEQCGLLSKFVCKTWIDEQIIYHKNKAKSSHTKNEWLEYSGWAVFGIALLVGLDHVFFHLLKGFENILVIPALALPAVAASLEGIRKHNEYSRLASLSENMEESLKDLKERFLKVRSSESLDALLREADELMLRETQGWLMLMRFLKLEPVL